MSGEEEKKGVSLPMVAGFAITAFGLVMALISPGSFWSVVAIVASVLAGGIMLHAADGKDTNLNISGWICILMVVVFLVYLTKKDAGEKRDVQTARAIAIIASQKLKQCGQTITPEEIVQTRAMLERSGGLEGMFAPPDTAKAVKQH